MFRFSSKNRALFLSVALFIPLVLWSNQAGAQPTFDILFQIGLDEKMDDEYLFGRPEFVVTDKDGDIYIADLMTLDIRRFDKNGLYKRSYGKRGRGPGEFHSITAMSISKNQEIVVYDARQRRITRFGTTDDAVVTVPFNYPIWPKRMIYSDASAGWIMLAKTSPFDAASEEQALQTIHSTNEEYSLEYSVGDYSRQGSTDLFHEVASQIHPGSIVENKGKLFHAPGVFDGKIYEYGLSRVNQWEYAGELASERYVKSNITMYEEEDFDPANMLKSTRMIPQDDESEIVRRVLVGRSNSQSAGLFAYKDNQLIHFVMYSPDTTAAYMSVEIYDDQGENIYRESLEHPFKDWPTRPTVYVGWKDDSDRYYLVHRTGVPHISVVQLRLN